MRPNQRWARPLVLGALALITTYSAAARAATVTFSDAPDNIIHLTGALGTDWRIYNKAGTDSGLLDGSCLDTVPGLGIRDAAGPG